MLICPFLTREVFDKVLLQDGQYKYPCCDAEMGCQVGKTCTPPIYTHISWWIYRTLKTDQSFSTPRSLHLSSTLSSPSFLILQSLCICRRGRQGCVSAFCVQCSCVCVYVHIHVALIVRVCVYEHGSMCLVAQSTTNTGCFSCSLSLVLQWNI